MEKEPSSRILNIVFVGAFNPAIITPMWLSAKKIVSEDEASSAKVEIVHPEVSKFEISDCFYEVFLDRFIVSTKHSHLFEKIQDNIINIFNYLQETPVYQLGINWHNIYEFLDSEKESYVNFGHLHVPKEDFWSKHLKNPGLHDLRIQSDREDGYNGKYNVYIKKAQGAKLAIDLHVNDHYELRNTEEKIYDARKAIEVVDSNFSTSRDFANKLLIEVFKYGTK